MSDERPTKSVNTGGILPQQGDEVVPNDEKAFFESFYGSTVDGQPVDRDTIGGSVSEPESRFHYNAVENAIIVAMAGIQPLPPPVAIRAWSELQRRANKRLLDIGSGTGHWVDFFVETYFVAEAVAVEVTEKMSGYLQEKYAARDELRVLNENVSSPEFNTDLTNGKFDYISAIGVMFHITDDERWQQAIGNLSQLLKDDGIMFIGGEFGEETQNVHFNKVDDFANWREFRDAEGTQGEVKINKRVRSLAQWREAAQSCGLRIVDLQRTHKEPSIAMPENDLLVLMRA